MIDLVTSPEESRPRIYSVDPLIDQLALHAQRVTADMDPALFRVRGLWTVNYRYRPNPLERDLAYSIVYVQTLHQGAAYVDFMSAGIDDSLLDLDARYLQNAPAPTRIAGLDAVYATLPRSPISVHTYEGTAEEKAVERARIICQAVADIAAKRGKKKILNVGVMGNFIPWIEAAGLTYVGSDYDGQLIRNGMNGRPVIDGGRTLDAIDEADIVLATGMTLSTGTLSEIIKRCQQSNVGLILFAATGSYFAQVYCREFRVDAVVAESQPQYMFQGVSRIEVHHAP